jgi:hypothetical protein
MGRALADVARIIAPPSRQRSGRLAKGGGTSDQSEGSRSNAGSEDRLSFLGRERKLAHDALESAEAAAAADDELHGMIQEQARELLVQCTEFADLRERSSSASEEPSSPRESHTASSDDRVSQSCYSDMESVRRSVAPYQDSDPPDEDGAARRGAEERAAWPSRRPMFSRIPS